MNIEDIKFKPIKKDITYYDVCIDIFVHSDRTTKGGFHIDNCGDIDIGPYYSIRNTLNKNNATNRKQLERLLALNQLLNIAEYYNKVHSDNTNPCTIVYCKQTKKYIPTFIDNVYTYGMMAFFNSEVDAQSVISNPNFTEILNTIYRD